MRYPSPDRRAPRFALQVAGRRLAVFDAVPHRVRDERLDGALLDAAMGRARGRGRDGPAMASDGEGEGAGGLYGSGGSGNARSTWLVANFEVRPSPLPSCAHRHAPPGSHTKFPLSPCRAHG